MVFGGLCINSIEGSALCRAALKEGGNPVMVPEGGLEPT